MSYERPPIDLTKTTKEQEAIEAEREARMEHFKRVMGDLPRIEPPSFLKKALQANIDE